MKKLKDILIFSVLLLLLYIESLSINNYNIEQGKLEQEEKMVDQAHNMLETVRNENVRYYNQRYHKARASRKSYVYGKQHESKRNGREDAARKHQRDRGGVGFHMWPL